MSIYIYSTSLEIDPSGISAELGAFNSIEAFLFVQLYSSIINPGVLPRCHCQGIVQSRRGFEVLLCKALNDFDLKRGSCTGSKWSIGGSLVSGPWRWV